MLLGLALTPTSSAQPIPTTWTVNGNGYTGLLVIQSVDPTTHEVRATLLGTPATGFLVDRHLVLHRYPQGNMQIWDGWILDPGLSAPGLQSYDGTPILSGTISQGGADDGLFPWYAVAQSAAGPPTGPPAGTSVIENGSFEQGPRRYAVTSGIPGWTVTRDNIDMVTTYWQQPHGEVSIDLAGTPGRGAIAQTFVTAPRRRYSVSFLMAGNAGCSGDKQMRVSAAGTNAVFTFDGTGRTLQDMGWVRRSWSFQATQASTTLTFEHMGSHLTCGMALDDVRVVAL